MTSADRDEHAELQIRLRRAYEPPGPDDGQRVLVDRLWPRGVTKASLRLDAWMRNVAPSDGLRRWFGHDPARWLEFVRRYRRELAANPESLASLLEAARRGPVTLVYGARDQEHNEAVALKQVLEEAQALASGAAGGETTRKEAEGGAG
jgi:uncharacterized protein YeaO (DUF488 family)